MTKTGQEMRNMKVMKVTKMVRAKKGSSLFVKIPTMQVGLNSDEGVPRYLRLSVQLELKDPSASKALKPLCPVSWISSKPI